MALYEGGRLLTVYTNSMEHKQDGNNRKRALVSLAIWIISLVITVAIFVLSQSYLLSFLIGLVIGGMAGAIYNLLATRTETWPTLHATELLSSLLIW